MSWYKNPFSKNKLYSVNKDIKQLNSFFKQDNIYKYQKSSYDPKLGVIRFWFENLNTKEDEIWHVWENDGDVEKLYLKYFLVKS